MRHYNSAILDHMSTIDVKMLQEERKQLMQELMTLDLMIHGTWLERYTTCSRPNCQCHRGKLHGPRHYLVLNENGKQKQTYISQRHKDAVLKGVTQSKRMLEIVKRVSQINLQLVKEDVYDDRDE